MYCTMFILLYVVNLGVKVEEEVTPDSIDNLTFRVAWQVAWGR